MAIPAKTRTEKHREDKIKSEGVHYTPEILANFFADQALNHFNGNPKSILDPACGDGELLKAISTKLQGDHGTRIVGFDLDQSAVDKTRADFLDNQFAETYEFIQKDFLNFAKDFREQKLFQSELDPESGFDIVIANPPYVRTQTLGSDAVKEIVSTYGLTGRIDLYTAFAFAMADVIKDDGVLALLCSNRFLTTKSGEPLRNLLMKDFTINAIYDLGDTKLFKAAVLPAIIIATKKKSKNVNVPFSSTYLVAKCDSGDCPRTENVLLPIAKGIPGIFHVNDEHFKVQIGTLSTNADTSIPWNLVTKKSHEILDRVYNSNFVSFGELTKIKVGIKTTADPIFISEEWANLEAGLIPEHELLRPLITHHVAKAWKADVPDRKILYTHTEVDGKIKAIKLEAFPRARKYLESHRVKLENRKYLLEAKRNWWEIWVPQKPSAWGKIKLVFPDISETPRFFVDETKSLVNGDCYWAVFENDDHAYLLAAVGNSRFANWFYDTQCGNQLYSGRRRYMTQYVERFPVPFPESEEAKRIVEISKAASRSLISSESAIEKVDELIAAALGFKEVVW